MKHKSSNGAKSSFKTLIPWEMLSIIMAEMEEEELARLSAAGPYRNAIDLQLIRDNSIPAQSDIEG